ncbi:hypothetical protein EU78_17305 [Mycolicibacterium rufum]|nr:hypothetical protein EU78_17305 [Mycolicibacterium rufum]
MIEDGLLTALPGGRDPVSGRLRVTAFVTARIDVTGDEPPVALSDCPTFGDWGALSGQMELSLIYRTSSGSGSVALHPDPASPRPDAQLWRTLFGRVTVGSGTFQDLSDQTVASFPSQAVATLIRATYAAVAEAAPTAFPPTTTGPLAGLTTIGRLLRRREITSAATHPGVGLPPFASPPPGSPPGTPGRFVDRSALDPPTTVNGGCRPSSKRCASTTGRAPPTPTARTGCRTHRGGRNWSSTDSSPRWPTTRNCSATSGWPSTSSWPRTCRTRWGRSGSSRAP